MTREKIALHGGISQEVLRLGHGAPVVWLHGISRVTAEDPLVAALAEHHAVIAPVMPGYHDLAELDEIRDIHDLALHYDSLLEALGLDGVTLIGHSFGAMLGAELAAHVPRRVARLVLISPSGLWSDAYPVADVMARPYPEIDALLWQGARHRPEPAAADDRPEDRVDRLVALANGLATVAKFTWPLPDKGLGRRLHRIRARTLVIFGADDAYVPARYADDFAVGIPGATTRVLPGSHMLPHERPDEVAGVIEAFLAGEL